MKLTAATLESLSSRPSRSFRRSHGDDAWEPDSVVDWSTPSQLTGDALERAWYITSQGSHAEQIGMLTAAQLMDQTDDLGTRLCLATAVSDEAKHSNVLARYAVHLKGSIQEPGDHVAGILAIFDGAEDFLGRFLIHTILEGFAADEFGIFMRYFRADPLAKIYGHLRDDELRHVAMGLDYLSHKLGSAKARNTFEFSRYEQLGVEATGISEEAFAWLADLEGTDPAQITKWFLSRHEARMKRLAFLPLPPKE